MALYHLHVKNLSRSDGRSVVAAAAYRAGVTLENDAEEKLSAFAGRRDVLMAELHLPADAPAWMADRQALWNAAEACERRKDARLAKEIEFSIPRELARDAWLEVARAMARHFAGQGFVVDLAVHDDGTGHNPHAHLLLATRAVTATGFGAKLRAADRKTFLKETRTTWQTIGNAALAKAGIAVTINAGSYAARGIDREPGTHHAPDPDERRRRRREIAAMIRDSDLDRARVELAADQTARERYPLLSQRPDWPPMFKNAPGVLDNPVRQEERAFWHEVRSRALGEYGQVPQHTPAPMPEGAAREERDREAPAPNLNQGMGRLHDKVAAATLKQGVERRAALAEAAYDYQRMFESINARMVAAGHLDPQHARKWEQVERAFRDPEFDELLAEARAIEARRNDRRPLPEATRAQTIALDRHEQQQAAREGVAFAPATVHRAVPPDPYALLAQGRPTAALGEPTHVQSLPPDPYAAIGRTAPPAPEVRPAPVPTLPPDPYALMSRPPAPTQDEEREPKPEPTWVWTR